MTGTHQRLDDAASADGPAGLGRVVPARDRAEPPPLPATAWSNVVPFVRPRSAPAAADSAPAIVVGASDRPAPAPSGTEQRARILGWVALSLLVHAGLYALTQREPEPMASVGLEAISVEIVLGANSPAGASTAPSENETQTAPTPQQPDTQPAEPEKTENQTPPEQTVTPEPQQTPPEPQQQQPPPSPETAAAPPEQTQPEPQPQAPPPPPESVAPVPPPPEPPKVEPAPKPVPKQETKPKPAPKHEAKPKPAPKRETEREAPRGKAAKRTDAPGPRTNASNGPGAGRSANDANYRGVVSAHLARYKRFPPEAQNRGAQGAATVTFTIGGSGGVTSVSLSRGTGVAALDQEAVAMVRRASPFPAPPNGRPMSFTVPVSYRMR